MLKVKQIPVSIITGFLGSGKTTLLNEIISANPGKKFAIIENEFGEIPIDNELVVDADDGIFEFSNGCICCSLNDDLVKIFMKLTRKAKKIDRIIIETTGIADPAPIISSLMQNPLLYAFFAIDSVICVIDTKNFERENKLCIETKKQLAYADCIILNKVSLTAPANFNSVYETVTNINPYAVIHETNYCDIDTSSLFNKFSFSLKNIEDNLISQFNNEKNFNEQLSNKHSHNQDSAHGVDQHHDKHNHHLENHLDHEHHYHTHGVNSVSFQFPGFIDEIKFIDWIKTILAFKGEDIYRGKGILNVNTYNKKIIFQIVQQDFLSNTGTKWGNGERFNKCVFIGKDLHKKMFEEGLRSTLTENKRPI